MVFEVPKSQASIGQNRFEFSLPGSKKSFSIPLAKYIKPEIVVTLAETPDVRGTRALLEHYAPGAWALFESNDQLEAFGAAWREASGIGLGESSASSNS
jgi:hypothetical protein